MGGPPIEAHAMAHWRIASHAGLFEAGGGLGAALARDAVAAGRAVRRAHGRAADPAVALPGAALRGAGARAAVGHAGVGAEPVGAVVRAAVGELQARPAVGRAHRQAAEAGRCTGRCSSWTRLARRAVRRAGGRAADAVDAGVAAARPPVERHGKPLPHALRRAADAVGARAGAAVGGQLAHRAVGLAHVGTAEADVVAGAAAARRGGVALRAVRQAHHGLAGAVGARRPGAAAGPAAEARGARRVHGAPPQVPFTQGRCSKAPQRRAERPRGQADVAAAGAVDAGGVAARLPVGEQSAPGQAGVAAADAVGAGQAAAVGPGEVAGLAGGEAGAGAASRWCRARRSRAGRWGCRGWPRPGSHRRRRRRWCSRRCSSSPGEGAAVAVGQAGPVAAEAVLAHDRSTRSPPCRGPRWAPLPHDSPQTTCASMTHALSQIAPQQCGSIMQICCVHGSHDGGERRADDALGVRAALGGPADAVAADAAAAIRRSPAGLAVGRARGRTARPLDVAAVAARLARGAEQAVGEAGLWAAEAVEAVVVAARHGRVAGGAVGVADRGAADPVGPAGAAAARCRAGALGAVGLAARLCAHAV